MHVPTPSIFYFAGFSAVVPYGPLEFQVCMLRWALSWCYLSLSFPPLCLLHRLGVLPLSGIYFQCHPGSQFIPPVHCEGFNRTFLKKHMLVTSLAFPILWGCLFARYSLACLLYYGLFVAFPSLCEIDDIMNRLVLAFLIVQGVSPHCICWIYCYITAWPARVTCRTQQNWFSLRIDFFLPPEWICRL